MSLETVTFGRLPAIRLAAPDGAAAIVTLFGGHLVSWTGADGRERLFLSARSALDGTKAIRGGVPVIFPQFATRGAGMRHGFARVSPWRVTDGGAEDGAAFAELELTQADLSPAHAAAWPHAFALSLRIEVWGQTLAMAVHVRNVGDAPFPFAAALHTYHLVDDVASVRIEGIGPQVLSVAQPIDRIFAGAEGPARLVDGAGTVTLGQAGFPDRVVWNPGPEEAAALSDLADDEYRAFACIEPLLLGPLTLEPGAEWRGTYRIEA